MDRYGNLRAAADSVGLERVSGPAATFGGPALRWPAARPPIQATYGARGNSVLQASGRRNQGQQQVDVGAPSVIRSAGHRQAGMAGTALATRPAVLVRDGAGNPLAGRAVAFSVTAGGGTVTGPVVMTDAAGVATVGSWVLGPTADLNTLTATVSGTGVTGSPMQFSASGCEGGGGAGYGITLCYASAVTPSQRAAFGPAPPAGRGW